MRFPAAFISFVSVFFLITTAWARVELGKADADNQELANSSSPYLQSHKRDLVKWHLWSDETFELARKSGKPVLVSFGYTACHWCHVMQETHFNEPGIAATINEKYIPVLVDRERRIALDELYLLVTEALTQQGGWPNTVFMTAERKPFYATTYIPPDAFARLLSAVDDGWKNDRQTLIDESERLAMILNGFVTRKADARRITPQVLRSISDNLISQYDPTFGGIGNSAKFYQQPMLMFMLQQTERDGNPALLRAVERTLQSILAGGVHDHIDGGFHRYSVDPGWRVPHFEKMLYDQAQLAEVFTAAYRITGAPEYAGTARKTLDYILADLTAPHGGFYSTRDADSEGEEGTFYVWTPQQLQVILGEDDAAYSREIFGVVDQGEFAGKVVLNLFKARSEDAERLERIFEKLALERDKRERPVRDEKIVASWNGLAIASMARAGVVFGEKKYIDAAVDAGNFIWNEMLRPDGGLYRIHFNGKSEIAGELDDYAQMARSFLFIYDATADDVWLSRAEDLFEQIIRRFEDVDSGDFFATEKADGFGRFKSRRDIDIASGNGAILDVVGRLASRTNNADYRRQAEKLLSALSGLALSNATTSTSIIGGFDRYLRGETGMVQYAGEGNVQASVEPSDDGKSATIRLLIAEGWHVNANKPLEEFLIPTAVQMISNDQAQAARITFPEPLEKSLSFNKKAMALYEDELVLEAKIEGTPGRTGTAAVDIQACSDKICLLPKTLYLQFAWPVN